MENHFRRTDVNLCQEVEYMKFESIKGNVQMWSICFLCVFVVSGCYRYSKEADPFISKKVENLQPSVIDFQVLAINDFHGQIIGEQKVSNRLAGGAAVLSSYLKKAAEGMEDRTVFAEVGDMVGASEPNSALLQDEPAIMIFNNLGNEFCKSSDKLNPYNNLVGTLGNHEWDEGFVELSRLIDGGNYVSGYFLENPWSGAHFPVVCANAINSETGLPVVPPFVIKQIPRSEIKVAFIGAILEGAASIVSASAVKNIKFTNEVTAINKNVNKLKDSLGIHTFIVLLHQGQKQSSYDGPTDSTKELGPGVITSFVKELDDDVDVVCTAHSHAFTNALVPNKNGKKILVTQASSKGVAYADIDMKIDVGTKDVVYKTAKIVTTWNDQGPGLIPDKTIADLVDTIKIRVDPQVNKVVHRTEKRITRQTNKAGESLLGDLIADAQCAVMATDVAFMNPGGIRTDIDTGDITWGDLFSVQPFTNYLVKLTLTGQQIYDVLNQQWTAQEFPLMLQISGITYTWDNSRPAAERVVEVRKNGKPISKTDLYSVSVNNFLAGGGDRFTVFTEGKNPVVGPIDLDAFIQHLSTLKIPLQVQTDGRVQRKN
jgi:5'-nucleotidase